MGLTTIGLLSSDVALAAIIIFSLALITWGVPGIILLAWHSSRQTRPLNTPTTRLDYTYATALVESDEALADVSLPNIDRDKASRPWVMGSSEAKVFEEEEETRPAYLKLRKYYGPTEQEEPPTPTDEADRAATPQ